MSMSPLEKGYGFFTACVGLGLCSSVLGKKEEGRNIWSFT